MGAGGRPPKVNIQELIDGVDAYIKKANPPIVAEYAQKHGITKQRLYQLAKENEEIFDSIKKITDAKEIMLEKKGLTGRYSTSMAIFSLKQLGWRDKIEHDVSTKDGMLADLISGLKEPQDDIHEETEEADEPVADE